MLHITIKEDKCQKEEHPLRRKLYPKQQIWRFEHNNEYNTITITNVHSHTHIHFTLIINYELLQFLTNRIKILPK